MKMGYKTLVIYRVINKKLQWINAKINAIVNDIMKYPSTKEKNKYDFQKLSYFV